MELAQRAVAAMHGQEAAEDLPRQVERQRQRREATEKRRREAQAISASRVAHGEGAELEADQTALRPLTRAERIKEKRRRIKEKRDELRADRPALRPLSQEERKKEKRRRNKRKADKRHAARAEDRRGQNKRKGGGRHAEAAKGRVLRRYERTHARELAQAEEAGRKAVIEHGIHHHFRPIAKVAFFCARMAASDRNGVIAREVLASINMPRERMEQVLSAAYTPVGYTPKRDTSRGQRAHEARSTYDGRAFGRRTVQVGEIDRNGWRGGQRCDWHPGAIAVLSAAVFAWLSKGNTRRAGYSHSVRGFGRGVWQAACGGRGKDALFGHTRGMPGAMLALKLAGFFEYGQPPAERVSVYDRGPSGHAYNVYWFHSTAAELQLDALRERLASPAALPEIQALLEGPDSWIERRATDPPTGVPLFSETDIPF